MTGALFVNRETSRGENVSRSCLYRVILDCLARLARRENTRQISRAIYHGKPGRDGRRRDKVRRKRAISLGRARARSSPTLDESRGTNPPRYGPRAVV